MQRIDKLVILTTKLVTMHMYLDSRNIKQTDIFIGWYTNIQQLKYKLQLHTTMWMSSTDIIFSRRVKRKNQV